MRIHNSHTLYETLKQKLYYWRKSKQNHDHDLKKLPIHTDYKKLYTPPPPTIPNCKTKLLCLSVSAKNKIVFYSRLPKSDNVYPLSGKKKIRRSYVVYSWRYKLWSIRVQEKIEKQKEASETNNNSEDTWLKCFKCHPFFVTM